MKTILLISPYWKEEHRWMVSSVKLSELWQRLGYKVVVVCMGEKTGIEQISNMLIIHRRKDFFLKDPLNFGIAFGFTGYVRKLIRSEHPDIIVCNKVLFWTSFSLIPLRLTGHKILLLTDALVGMTWWPRPFFAKVIMGCGAWTVGWPVLLCAKKIVFFHPQPVSLLSFLGIKKKSVVIPTGIDSGQWTVDSGQSDGHVVVTYVGRLESVKGTDDFLAAVVPLKKDHPNLTVQVVGWYKEGHPLVNRYEGEAIFTGLRDDIPEILQRTAIFVLPSYSEGLSNALMEAMASGCACVCSEVGGNRYLIQNGVSGLLFPPGDREALKAHVRRLIEDPFKRESLGRAARKRIEEEFDWSIVGKKYEKLFSEL